MDEHGENTSKIRIAAAGVIILAAFVFFLKNVLAYTAPVPAIVEPAPAVALAAPVEEYIGQPARLFIPTIGVDAAVEGVALAPDGSMDVPKESMIAGWYSLGHRPGEAGSAVIDGHVDWYNGASGVFAGLSKLVPGDVVTVLDDAGTRISFVVRETRVYDAAADATEVFASTDGLAHLNLITCNGAWDKSAGQYKERLVVFADRAASEIQ